ncbi:virulence RhuM family protein [bacterium]|nr:virulence RhuM family protein [bacterium]
MEKKYELIKFEDGDFSLDVNVSPNEETVWLTQNDMASLFGVDRTRITRHVNNIISEHELPISVCAENALTASDGKTYNVAYYNLDMILAIGYRVNSKRGIQFRIWANSILKKYLLNGYVVNADRIISYQSNILQLEASVINTENITKEMVLWKRSMN